MALAIIVIYVVLKVIFIKDCKMNVLENKTENDNLGNEKCNCISSFMKPHRRKKCLINNIIQKPVIKQINKTSSPNDTIKILLPEEKPIIEQVLLPIELIKNISCDKKTHLINECFANKDIKENIILDDNFSCKNCNKTFDTQKGLTCHQNLYCKNKPVKEKTDKCYRCGREGQL